MSAGVWLERASAEDVLALAALSAASVSHPWTAAQYREEVSYGPPGAVLLLRGAPNAGDRGIRAYCVYRVMADEMEILDLAVHAAWRRQGLARWLLRYAMAKAARVGARRAYLEVRRGNGGAIALYRELGFGRLAVRRAYYREPPEDALVLARNGLAPGQP